MKLEKIEIGGKMVMPFTIPSGIITTSVASLEKLAKEIPELGILTTKSIGPEPRAGNREPILAQYSRDCFINAVGLTNPGAEEFARELAESDFPKDKFLLTSIFGKDVDEFVYVAKTLEEHVDGFELNVSCPHAKKVGMALGQDPKIVNEITKAVVSRTGKPVFVKLTPNVDNIGEIAQSAVGAGAYGITAINTVGPQDYLIDGNPVLTNKVGGLSGWRVFSRGIRCIKDIRQAVGEKIPIIGMGGIGDGNDVRDYAYAGANVFGVGSTLAGKNDLEIKTFFHVLGIDLENETNNSGGKLLKKVDMNYKPVEIDEVINEDSDFKIFKTNQKIEALPGQFVFAWIPGVGEKPFSIMDDDPLTLGILKRGEFTGHFNNLKPGEDFYFRGPYGQGVDVPNDSNVVLVGGGCGVAGLYLLAKKFSEKADVISLLGAKDKSHLPYLERFGRHGNLGVATEDGSRGIKGTVADFFRESNLKEGSYFFNCGPRAMINAILPLELEVSSSDKIYSSVDYMTRCGVGICGSCANEKGRRSCVEGPFMNSE